jgi:F-box-like
MVERQLPVEIISYMMEFLPLADRISASLTCRLWYEASRSRTLHAKEVVFVHNSRAIQDLCPEAFIHPDTFEVDPIGEPPPFQNFTFREVEVKTTGEMRRFWPRFGPNIKRLSLQDCEISEKAFSDVLALCPKLQFLQISECNELYMSGKVLEAQENLRLEFLTELELSNSRYISDVIFNRFISIAPNLQMIVLLGCNIACSSAVYKRFYPAHMRFAMEATLAEGRIPLDGAANVFTFHNVLNVLSIRQVTGLCLEIRSLANENLKALCEKVKGVQNLNLRHCFQLVKGIESIACAFADSLQTLDISDCCFIVSAEFFHLEKLRALRSLNLNLCKNLEDPALMGLKSLSNLESLNISNVERISGPGICEVKFKPSNVWQILSIFFFKAVSGMKKLKHLYMNRIALMDSDSLLKILKILPPLITLELAMCMVPLIDAAISVICNQHTSIKRLNLANCPFVRVAFKL